MPRTTSGVRGLAAEHVAELRGLVVERVVTDAEEVHEHQFGDRTQSSVNAAPAAMPPMMADSVIGVSMTRSGTELRWSTGPGDTENPAERF